MKNMDKVFVVQSLSRVWLFETPWTVACQIPLSSTISWSLLKFMSIESVMLFNHLILCCLLLFLLSVFPSIRVFSNQSALHIRWPKYWSFTKIFRKSVFGRKWFRIYNQGYITMLLVFSDAAAVAKSLQSCPTLWDPIDGSPPASAIPGILQARTLEWVAISFSNVWSEKWKWSRSVVSDSSDPVDCSLPGSSIHGIF